LNNQTNFSIECAKRWQQSLDPELDHSEWREEEVRIKYLHIYESWQEFIDNKLGSDSDRSNAAARKALEGHTTRTLSRTIEEYNQEPVCILSEVTDFALTSVQLHRACTSISKPRHYSSKSCQLAI
jgi:hypothetical protein